MTVSLRKTPPSVLPTDEEIANLVWTPEPDAWNNSRNPHSFAYRAEPSLIRSASTPHPTREHTKIKVTHARSFFMFKRTGALYFFRIGRLSGSFCWTARK